MSDTDQDPSETDETEIAAASDGAGSNRQRLIWLAAMAAVLFAFGLLYLLWASGRVDDDLAEREARAQEIIDEFEAGQSPAFVQAEPTPVTFTAAAPETVPQPGEVLVVNRVPGDDYGRLAIRHADGSRTLLDRSCLRVHIAAENGVCLSADIAFLGTYTTTLFPVKNLNEEYKSYPSLLPSRARVSPDGRFSATTGFISGSSYEDISGETSTIVTFDEIGTRQISRSGSAFQVNANDSRYNGDGEYWGVTFGADAEIYVTGFFDTSPEIMRGSLDDMTLEPTGWIGSCPSLSPDGKTLVFKEMKDDGGFDLVAVDVESQDKWLLSETRSVDDQVEWLDNDTILYALHPEGDENLFQPEFDIWMLDIAPGSEPELFLPNADSPAVAR